MTNEFTRHDARAVLNVSSHSRVTRCESLLVSKPKYIEEKAQCVGSFWMDAMTVTWVVPPHPSPPPVPCRGIVSQASITTTTASAAGGEVDVRQATDSLTAATRRGR